MFEIARLPQDFFLHREKFSDQDACVKLAIELLSAMNELGMTVNARDFIEAWASGYKVLVERDDNSKHIIAVALFICDSKFYDFSKTATILEYAGKNYPQMIAFAKSVAQANGAYMLIYDMKEDQQIDNNKFLCKVIKEII